MHNTNEPILLVFDFDGCLYPFPNNFRGSFQLAQNITGHLLSNRNIDYNKAGKICLKSYYDHGIGYKTLCDEFGTSLGEGNILHHRFLNFDLKPDPLLIECLRDLDKSRVHLMILTQGSHCFLDRKLDLLGIKEFFPRGMRIAFDDYGFELKKESTRPFVTAQIMAEEYTGKRFKPRNIHMFEDTSDNLQIPHLLGWRTNLVHHGNPSDKLPDFIHAQASTISPLIRTFPQRWRNTPNLPKFAQEPYL